MICPQPIRRLTAAERDARDAQHQATYERIYADIEAREREEYDRSFGPTYRAKFPYKADGSVIHFKMLNRIAMGSE